MLSLKASISRTFPVHAVLLLLLLVLGPCTHLTAGNAPIATSLATHVLNVTLNAAGWPTTETELATYVASLATQVNTTVCGSLPSTVSTCTAFMTAVNASSTPVQVAVQTSVRTSTAVSGNGTYTLLSNWAAGTNLFSLSALAGTLSTPTFSAGIYTAPCRGWQTYAYLPACAPGEAANTTVYVRTTSTNLQSTFLSYLCPSTSTTTCTASVTVTTSSTSDYQTVTITGTSRGLEAVLAFVADARASVLGTSNAITGETVGDSTKQLAVTSVELRYRTTRAVLFSSTENQRTYIANARLSLQCESSYSMWAIALVVIPFLAIGLFRYIYYRGRRRAKKQERRRVVEDETRLMQSYTNPADAQAAGTAPPPGVDPSAAAAADAAPEWVMDANGNYYDANAAAAADNGPMPGTADAGAGEVTYQTWVDPETGDTYQYAVDSTGAPVDTTGYDTTQQEQPQEQPTEAAAAADGATYQTYVDPNTGETYQYAVDNSADAAQTTPAAATEDNVTYQTYVDPETGETYQYAVDPTAAAAPETAAAGDDSATAAAAAEGDEAGVTYQTYVDPETGETYQYAVDPAAATSQDAAATGGEQSYVDPSTGETYQYAAADGQQYEYVDPTTGETYVYDASAAQGDDAAAATDAAAAGDAQAVNTYVDPNTGETYQYEAEPNAEGSYQYVDPETGETYQYQDPNAAQ